MAIQLKVTAKEKSTYAVTVAFLTEAGVAVVRASARWTLTSGTGAVINGRTQVAIAPLAATVTVVLQGADLAFQAGEATTAVRLFTIEATYDSTLGTSLPLKEECRFLIDDLLVVT